jgi:hypothetical protein
MIRRRFRKAVREQLQSDRSLATLFLIPQPQLSIILSATVSSFRPVISIRKGLEIERRIHTN